MRTKTYETAVSPVVGVMLMLVVTIIIAAVVSAFAGGLGAESKKTPQMTFSASYSQAGGLTLFHSGGDTLTASETRVELIPTTAWTDTAYYYVFPLETKNITSSSTGLPWGSGTGKVSSFMAGDSASVLPASLACSVIQPQVFGGSTASQMCFDEPANVGKPVIIRLIDKKSNIIAKTEVNVKP
jgi:archaeal type IV pilus assembly protein PilA